MYTNCYQNFSFGGCYGALQAPFNAFIEIVKETYIHLPKPSLETVYASTPHMGAAFSAKFVTNGVIGMFRPGRLQALHDIVVGMLLGGLSFQGDDEHKNKMIAIWASAAVANLSFRMLRRCLCSKPTITPLERSVKLLESRIELLEGQTRAERGRHDKVQEAATPTIAGPGGKDEKSERNAPL